MNGYERVLCALQRTSADRIPLFDSFWVDTLSRWHEEGLPKEASPEDYFEFDIRMMSIDASPRFRPELIGEEGEMITLRDRFGYVVKKQKNKSRTMQFLSHPVTNRRQWDTVKERLYIDPAAPARIDVQSFPFRLDMGSDWEQVRRAYEHWRDKGYYLLANAYGPHEAILRLHGFETTLYSLYDNPDLLEEMAGTYSDFLLSVIDDCLDHQVRFDGFFMVEDLAGVNGMLFSPDLWRRIFRPSVEKIGQYLKSQKLHFWMHSCGNAEPVFADLIECGLDVLNPLEAKAGLDVRRLKSVYGEQLTFLGNINVMKMAGNEMEMETEIREKILIAKQGGGYIYHSDHSVPPEVTWPRYQQIIKLVKQYGKYSKRVDQT